MAKLIAGIDIGNATTEMALAETGAEGQVRFLPFGTGLSERHFGAEGQVPKGR